MEEELQSIGGHLTQATTSAISPFEEDIKRMYAQAYTRASACFTDSASYSDSMKCGETALAPVKLHKTATMKIMRGMQQRFKSCLAACGMNQQRYLSDDLKVCMRKCEEKAITEIHEAVPELKALTRPRT